MVKIISIGIGGFLGAITRYLLAGEVEKYFKSTFPFGTLVVNLIGCFLLGFIFSLTLNREMINPTIRTAITTGFLGALTTFSTFTYETLALLEGENLFLALSNVVISVVLGLLMGWFGIITARII
ncbi:hypothetical protein BBF96_01430 [Anoxybacter fermentans]|uniref:Fluoride-specific ion channel FluC n=1 Tax=Anoxybacter fermentans TaxID=1323375 RepID=A0A3Q9HNM0_9FIRM|nr:fluoride efflux transporter CrcB [Anoxybacter fermentans]AZR72172.1 hypothetical protein BBF96_01430 [Anoxybacter fermentans]